MKQATMTQLIKEVEPEADKGSDISKKHNTMTISDVSSLIVAKKAKIDCKDE